MFLFICLIQIIAYIVIAFNLQPKLHQEKKDSSGKNSITLPSSSKWIIKETPEDLDTSGRLKQYVKPYSGGFYIGFENGTQ